MDDRTVELRLSGVRAIVVAYDATWNHERPSEFEVPNDLCIQSLSPWPLPSIEAWMSINSKRDLETVELAARRDLLLGDLSEGSQSAARVCLGVDMGIPRIPITLWIACDGITPFASDKHLELQEWADQYDSWWKKCNEHWDEKPDYEPDIAPPPVEEDAFIPAGSNDDLDRKYKPPSEPAFALDLTDAPHDLLSPLRDWFEAVFLQEWERRAKSERNPDESLADQTAKVQEWLLGDSFGSWDYARQVDSWWIEGRRAHVRVVGVKHYMPMDGDPAENQLTQWDFALRQRDGEWVIHTYSEGGEVSTEGRRWIADWGSGTIE